MAAAPGAIRSAAARALGEGLRVMAARRPLALLVDDVHFVDETALDAIEYAALKEAGAPVWVLAVGRPSFAGARTGWAGRAAERQSVTLAALEPPAAAELARRLLAPVEKVPASALARLAERTMGVPLLLVELCRGLKRDGVVRKSDMGAWVLATDELERLPDLPLVQWLASRETESLPPDLLAHARLASVLGFGVQRRRGRGGAAGAGARRRRAGDAARRQHRPAAPDRERHPGAAPGRARRVPPLAAARHGLPVGAGGRARVGSPRGVRTLSSSRRSRRHRAPAADGVPRRQERASRRRRAPVPRPRAPRERAARVSGGGAAVPERDREHARHRDGGEDRRPSRARPHALSPGPPRRRAQELQRGAQPHARRSTRAPRGWRCCSTRAWSSTGPWTGRGRVPGRRKQTPRWPPTRRWRRRPSSHGCSWPADARRCAATSSRTR